MKTRVHYPEEIKWKVIEMKKDGYSNRTISVGLAFPSQSDSKEKATSTSSSTIMYMQSSHGDSW